MDHILLAEFDVDTGSTVRHKYPSQVPGYTDDFLANFMLPEGAHNREYIYIYIYNLLPYGFCGWLVLYVQLC